LVEGKNLLVVEVERNSKVLPLGKVDWYRPERGTAAVEDLEALLVGIALSNERSGLELNLVVAVVGSLVPDIEVLVSQVQRLSRVLLDAPVQGLDTLASLAVGGVLEKLETGATEAVLSHENGLVVDGDLESLEVASIKARDFVWELQDLRPCQVVALDVVGVEDGVGGLDI